MINTYNESNLHLTLKKLYALEYNGKTEQAIDNWICDVVTENGDIIEIQTANISKLTKKVEYLLAQQKHVTIVHPIIHQKTIETVNKTGEFLSRRKSPRKNTIYSILRELTGIYPLLTKKNFTLEVLFISIREQRCKVEMPTQLANKSRRFLKTWIPQEKDLEAIISKQRFSSQQDYEALIPPLTPKIFSASQLEEAIFNLPAFDTLSESNKKHAAKQARLLIWLYIRMGILELHETQGRKKLYRRLTTI